MTRRGALAGLLVGTALALAPSFSRPAVSQSADCPILAQSTVPARRLAALARGFNLPGWLDGTQTRRPDMATLAALRQRGFTHIRLPVTPERLSPEFSAASDIARDRAELGGAIDRLISMGFAVSLDLHPGERMNELHKAEPERALALLDGLWRKLVRQFAAHPADRLFFEILNEPSVSRAVWEMQGPQLAATVRANAPNHTIIFGTTDFQQISALPPAPPVALPNVVYAVHYYAPMVFTHQGLDWTDGPLRDLRDVPFPLSRTDSTVIRLSRDLRAMGRNAAANELQTALREPWDARRITAEIGHAAQWAKHHKMPVVLNEFGVLARKAPSADRLLWLETVRRAAEQACIGWAHWDYADAFGFVHRVDGKDIPDQAVLRALLDE
jgi:endoglucanase